MGGFVRPKTNNNNSDSDSDTDDLGDMVEIHAKLHLIYPGGYNNMTLTLTVTLTLTLALNPNPNPNLAPARHSCRRRRWSAG